MGSEGDYDMFFKYLEVAMLDNKVRIAMFSLEKKHRIQVLYLVVLIPGWI